TTRVGLDGQPPTPASQLKSLLLMTSHQANGGSRLRGPFCFGCTTNRQPTAVQLGQFSLLKSFPRAGLSPRGMASYLKWRCQHVHSSTPDYEARGRLARRENGPSPRTKNNG